MEENKYHVIISNETGKIAGSIEDIALGDSHEKLTFDPTTVLCDLLDRQCYHKHPFHPHSDGESDWFNNILDELERLCREQRNLSLSQFEVFKQIIDTTFTYKIEIREDNPGYGLNVPDELYDEVQPDSKYRYFVLGENNHFTMEELLNYYEDYDLQYNYSCHSLEDVICSVWHYLILHEYKFSCCNHCGRYFATQTLKKQYCDRKSPYPKFQQHNCEQAVRNIKQKLARRKKSAYTYLNNEYSGAVNQFLNEYARLKDAVDERSSVENLKALEAFCSKERVRENWYKDEFK